VCPPSPGTWTWILAACCSDDDCMLQGSRRSYRSYLVGAVGTCKQLQPTRPSRPVFRILGHGEGKVGIVARGISPWRCGDVELTFRDVSGVYACLSVGLRDPVIYVGTESARFLSSDLSQTPRYRIVSSMLLRVAKSWALPRL
jgi:hypothetical protein